jgi:hypothetical protein
MLGLGGSIATPAAGITADVMVVTSYDELRARAAEARGKIVLFNVPFTTYGQTVQYRSGGAVAAARVGAVASIIRSVTPYSMRTPHTGGMAYNDSVPKIPHAAITADDADMIARMIGRGQKVTVKLTMSARMMPDAQSRNVIAELRGSTSPDEVVVMGGHIDSWDVGRGAMDDAGGVVVAWEAIRILKELGLRPRRTIRVVGWTNEENGVRGGTGYRDAHRAELDKHIAAIESDGGVFKPVGFGFTGSDQQKRVGVLSGGERNRLHLARMLKSGANVILLDEPTNDLDVNTIRAMEEALENFAGCAVVVSHDRWFLDRLATHILAFEGDSQVVWHEGNFQSYEEEKRKRLGQGADQPHRIKYRRLTK